MKLWMMVFVVLLAIGINAAMFYGALLMVKAVFF